MRIRTAAAAAALATAAILGSAGTAFADHNDNNIAADNDNNHVRVDPRIVDFTEDILSRNTSVSDNDVTHTQDWEVSNVSDNWSGNFSGDVSVGDMSFDSVGDVELDD